MLFGIAVGFVLGSRASRGPYQQIEGKVREVGARPEVQKAINAVTGRAKEQASDVASTVHDRVSEVADNIGDRLPTSVSSNRN